MAAKATKLDPGDDAGVVHKRDAGLPSIGSAATGGALPKRHTAAGASPSAAARETTTREPPSSGPDAGIEPSTFGSV